MTFLPLTIDQSNLSIFLRETKNRPSVAVSAQKISGLSGDSPL